jgi:NAD(P)-dependent dehydrogenase (short-subunit alcohol dehydrogenase family)
MILDLKGKKAVVIGGRNSIGRAIAEAVAREGADVVIWLREWNDNLNQSEVLPLTQLEVPSQQPNGTSLHTSLWRETMAHRSYW